MRSLTNPLRSVSRSTIAYVERRTADGLSKPDIMRRLKRYVARELFSLIRNIATTTTANESAA